MPKNYRIVPKKDLQKIRKNNWKKCYVGTKIVATKEDVIDGKFKNIGLSYNNAEFTIDNDEILPPISAGKFSKYNCEEQIVKMKDQPKETFDIEWEAPNFGDDSNGTHTISIERERYPRKFITPSFFTLKISNIIISDDHIEFALYFNKKIDCDNHDELLKAINILHENVGMYQIFEEKDDIKVSIPTEYINWVLLPPGVRDKAIKKMLSARYNADQIKQINDRIEFLEGKKPIKCYEGIHKFNKYVVYQFKNFVVLENLNFGNALYLIFEDWEEISKKTRLELIKNKDSEKFCRIIHTNNYKNNLKTAIKSRKLNW